MTQVPGREGITAKDVAVIAALTVLGVGVPLWLAAAAGAVGIPSNDDWVYMRAANSLFRTDSIDIVAHTTAFIGQLAMVQPFLWLSGGSPWAYIAFGLVMTAIGIVLTYLLARRFVGTGSAALAVLLVLAFPGFARQSASFMTDGPTYSLIVLCLWFGIRWLQGSGGPATLLGSIGAGVLAVSIREFAIAAPVAILAVAWVRSLPNERLWLLIASTSLAIGVAIVVLIGATLPRNAQGLSVNVYSIGQLAPAFITLSAVLLPAAAPALARRIAEVSARQVLGAAGLVGLLVALAPHGPLLGNLWTATGLGGGYHGFGGFYNGVGGDFLLTGSRDPLFPGNIWTVSEQVAIFAAVVLATLGLIWGHHNLIGVTSISTGKAVMARVAKSPDAPLLFFVILYAAELVLYSAVGALYDRYLYPLVPVAAILLLRSIRQPVRLGRSHAFAHGALAWLAISAFLVAANSFAYDAARYREGVAAVAMGYDAGTVDAGYEWVGAHGVGPEQPHSNPYSLNWWESNWPSFRPCAVLSNSPFDSPAYRLIRVNQPAYQQFLFFGPDMPLYLYGASMEGCPPVAARPS